SRDGRLGGVPRNAGGIAIADHGDRRAERGVDCAAVADAAPRGRPRGRAASRHDRRRSIGTARSAPSSGGLMTRLPSRCAWLLAGSIGLIACDRTSPPGQDGGFAAGSPPPSAAAAPEAPAATPTPEPD